MTELQIFAFFILPLAIGAFGFIGGYLETRRQRRQRHTPAE